MENIRQYYDYIEIGSGPSDESGAQVGDPEYSTKARIECRAFINQLIRKFGEPPVGAKLSVKGFEHDFGRYYEVVCYFTESKEKSVEYAFKLESETPAQWDKKALKELEEEYKRHGLVFKR